MNTHVSQYWGQFWRNFANNQEEFPDDPQSQVLRIREKKPISPELWDYTVKLLLKEFPPSFDGHLLDLCGGNGLLSEVYSPLVEKVTLVDISQELVQEAKNKNLPNLIALSSDIRHVDFASNSFTQILWYAGIQYLDLVDIVSMMRKIATWLAPGGSLFIGDIPDEEKMWDYFNTSDRKHHYFNSLVQGRPMIGTWPNQDWLRFLLEDCQFRDISIFAQDEKLIYADFRYDLKASI